MRHRCRGRHFSRRSNHRKALLKNLACQLIKHELIKTTVEKAKDIRPIVEKLVTKGRVAALSTRRYLMKNLGCVDATNKILTVLAQKYVNCNGGYLRIIKANKRLGDCAPQAIIAFREIGD